MLQQIFTEMMIICDPGFYFFVKNMHTPIEKDDWLEKFYQSVFGRILAYIPKSSDF